MPEPTVKKQVQTLYKEAKKNKDFKADLVSAGGGHFVNKEFYGNTILKNIFSALYLGWKIGKGIK